MSENEYSDNPRDKATNNLPAKPLDEKGALSMFTVDEIEEMRRELAKRSKLLKRN